MRLTRTHREKLFKAVLDGDLQNLIHLLENVETVNIQDSDLKTPLIHAVCHDVNDVRFQMVCFILRYKCNVNLRDKSGLTALMYVCMEADRLDVVRLIAKHKKCNPNVQDNEGYTAAMHAVAASNAHALKILVKPSSSSKHSIDLNITNNHGLTALSLAVRLQMSECCKI
ncbi:hypothetical protein KUTeg_018621 [Tegillarca granosa]|uniref:Uncharacterized protein n=1 Tax=Tegillarca granosa TaxID=220873 RepID=A0ABQ9EEV1_TEGGR|nr:hypothetical protein KUTeg_018621 [Tegillarca granosa]